MSGEARTAHAESTRDERILSVAMRLFGERGFHETDIDDVARLAAVGKGTVYRHFGVKRDLFLAVVKWGLDQLEEEILRNVRAIDTPERRIRTAIRTYLGFFQRHREFYRVLVDDRERLRKEVEGKFSEKYLACVRVLQKTLTLGVQEEGAFKQMDAESVAVAIVGLTNAIIYKWLITPSPYALMLEFPLITEMCFRGIAGTEMQA